MFARGSGQNSGTIDSSYINSGLNTKEYQSKTFFDEIDKRVTGIKTEYISLHDFSGKYNQRGYIAVDVATGFTNKPHYRKDVPNLYYESVKDGAEELSWFLEDRLTSCPFQQVILGGYSQGAEVVGDALNMMQKQFLPRINYVALYGDPKFNPRTSTLPVITGPWVRGNAWSIQSGILLPRKTYLPAEIANAGSWCDFSDPICANFGIFQNPVKSMLTDMFIDRTHQNIYQNKWIPQSANEIVNKLRKNNQILSSHIQTTNWVNKNDKLYQTDLAIVLDVSGSMINTINNIKNKLDSFTTSLFNSYWDTRIALVGFSDNDLESPYIAKVLTDFTYSKEPIKSNIANINPTPNTGGDDPEAQIAGLMMAMDNLHWRQGAQKKILVISDAAPKNPDPIYGSWTKEQIVKKALELDPASISFENPPRITEWQSVIDKSANYFSSSTNGIRVNGTYSYKPEEILSALGAINVLPVAAINGPSGGYVGEPVALSGGDSYDPDSSIKEYAWDCNNDGVWDITSSIPTAECAYSQPYSGFVVLEARSEDGGSAKATLSVNITPRADPISAVPDSPSVSVVRSESDATISWQNNYTDGTIIRIEDTDGNVLGYAGADNNFVMSDIADSSFSINVFACNTAGCSDPAVLQIPELITTKDIPISESNPQWELDQEKQFYANLARAASISLASNSNISSPTNNPSIQTAVNTTNQTNNTPATTVAGIETNKPAQQTATLPTSNPDKIILYVGIGLLIFGALAVLWYLKKQ